MNVRELAEKYEDYVISCRHWLHQHPELAWEEHETTRFIENELRKMGIEPQRFAGELTGLHATIEGGKAGPGAKTILLRADIDALPTQELTQVPYASLYEGRMHACGHDTHVAMLLGAAKILSENSRELQGNVKLLFQGGEETAIGAKYYVEQGVMEGVDAVYGCHIASWLDTPYISVDPGPRAAACDEFSIVVEGVACHGGMPYVGRDAIVAASAIVMNLQNIVSRRTDSLDALVITVGTMNGGQNYNVVADRMEMTGTVRSYSREVRANVPSMMEEVAQNTAKAFGCSATVEYQWKTPAVVHEDERMNRIAREAVLKLYGPEGLATCRAIGGGDDFAYYLEKAPGIFAMIGGKNEALDCVYGHHHPRFNVDESVFVRGTAMFVQMAEDFLSQ